MKKAGTSSSPKSSSAPRGRTGIAPGGQDVIARLLASEEPSIRYKVRVNVLGEDPHSAAIGKLRDEIRRSPRVAALLSERNDKGVIPYHPYSKWCGAHWVLRCWPISAIRHDGPQGNSLCRLFEPWLTLQPPPGAEQVRSRRRSVSR